MHSLSSAYETQGKGNSMTRQEIIDVFIVRAAPADRAALRRKLDKMSLDELEEAYKVLQLQATEDQLLEIQADRAAAAAMHKYQAQKAHEPQRKAEEKAQLTLDRQTFGNAAKTLRSFAVHDANFNVIRQTLGAGFSVYQIQQMVAANGATLSPPEQHELDEWTRQDIEAHNLRLLSADLPTLRRLTREAGARIAAGPPPGAMDQVQTVRAAEKSQNNQFQPLLSDSRFKGEIIDLELVRQLDGDSLKQLIRIYGADAITARIREWS